MLPSLRAIPPGPAWCVNDIPALIGGRRHAWFGIVGAEQPYIAGQGVRIITHESQGLGYADFLHIFDDCLCTMHDRVMPEWLVAKSDHGGWMAITVRLSGDSRHMIGDCEDVVRGERTSTMVFYPAGVETCEWFRPRTRLLSLTVLMRPSFLLDTIGLLESQLPPQVRRLLDASPGSPPVVMSMPFPGDLERTVIGLMCASTVGQVRHLQARAVSMLLCCSAANWLRAHATEKVEIPTLTAAEEARIHDIRAYMLADISESVSIPALARRAGMNRTKLQAGFKNLFGETVFECTERHRMARAMEYLHDCGVPIYEVARRVGYAHARNFSAAFRRYYGVLPREVH